MPDNLQEAQHIGRHRKSNFLPDLQPNDVTQLQKTTAEELGLPIFFFDQLKVGGTTPQMEIFPAGQYIV